MFEHLTNKRAEVFSTLKKAPSLNEKQVEEGLRKIRQVLFEAYVSLPVAKELIHNINYNELQVELVYLLFQVVYLSQIS